MRLNIRKSLLPVCVLTLGVVACGDDDGVGVEDETAGETAMTETGEMPETGDGDGDTTGDGDGDSGDGDGDTTGDGDGDSGDGDGDSGDGDGDGDGDPLDCINEQFVSGMAPGPGYGDLGLVLGSHCQGTNHQAIEGVERVVFIGDSVTVGSPPTATQEFYRVLLAEELSFLFGIDAPNLLWGTADPINGTALIKEDGDFASCAEWGARTDDFPMQLGDCFSGNDFNKKTLVVTTMGGNDIAAIAKDAIEGVAEDALWADIDSMLNFQRDMVHWLVDDPNKFPNGVYVVFANVYEFTDATADLLSCPAAGLAGFDANPDDPDLIISMMTEVNTEYAKLAAETQTDVMFMFEGFCGHGYHADDPQSQCYRGPDNETWFDLTCIHPTPTGHQEIADMFLNVISE